MGVIKNWCQAERSRSPFDVKYQKKFNRKARKVFIIWFLKKAKFAIPIAIGILLIQLCELCVSDDYHQIKIFACFAVKK